MKRFLFLLTAMLTLVSLRAESHFPPFPLTQMGNTYLVESDIDTVTKPYLLPKKHPAKALLDSLCAQSNFLKNEKTLADAGFITLFSQPTSFVTVAKHPSAPGYIFKLYLESEKRLKRGKPGWVWLLNRCVGAERIRELIEKQRLNYFCVADKWLYRVPNNSKRPLILVATDMRLVGAKENALAWKTLATKEHLKELYYILGQGCGSYFLTGNIPYTQSGKFAFIDTEYPHRRLSIINACKYLSDDMAHYWRKLLRSEKYLPRTPVYKKDEKNSSTRWFPSWRRRS